MIEKFLKKVNFLKFKLGLGCSLAVIAILIFVATREKHIVIPEQITTPQVTTPEIAKSPLTVHEESESSQSTIPSGRQAIDKQFTETSNLQQTQSDLSKKLEALESVVSDLKANQQQSAAVNKSDEDKDDVVLTPEQEDAKVAAETQAIIDMMEEKLQAEPVDSEWSDWAEKELSKKERDSNKDFKVVNLDCHSTFCRVDLEFNVDLNKEEELGKLQDIIPWNGELFIHVDDVDNGQAIIYVSREGHSLPSLK
ncbi:MAG: hypothetical protein AB1611_22020 [bacterium]